MNVPLRGPALSESIRDYIKEYIIENKLKAGDPLPPESELVETLGVGRSSVREAVKALQSLGIVEIRRGNGLYVRAINFDAMLEVFNYGMQADPLMFADVFHVRVWLESAVIQEAVGRISDEDFLALENLLSEWEYRVATGQPFADLDERFHFILYASLNNSTLVNLLEVFWTAFTELDIETIRDADPAVALADHRDLLKVIRTRDPLAAQNRLIEHFRYVQERIERVIEPVDSPHSISE